MAKVIINNRTNDPQTIELNKNYILVPSNGQIKLEVDDADIDKLSNSCPVGVYFRIQKEVKNKIAQPEKVKSDNNIKFDKVDVKFNKDNNGGKDE